MPAVQPQQVLTQHHKDNRRLAVNSTRGLASIPNVATDLSNRVRDECDGNMHRKDFTPEEAVAIAEFLEPAARRESRKRQVAGLKQNQGNRSGKLPGRGEGNATDAVAKAVGKSRVNLDKAKKVVEAARKTRRHTGLSKMRRSAPAKWTPPTRSSRRPGPPPSLNCGPGRTSHNSPTSQPRCCFQGRCSHIASL